MSDQLFLTNLHLILKGEITQARQDILVSLKSFWDLNEIETEENWWEKQPFIQLSLMSQQWGIFGSLKLTPVDQTQTMVNFIIPPYPDFEETERFETAIRETIGPSAPGLRLIDLGPREGLLAFLGKHLQDHRLQLFNMLYTRLVYTLKMSPFHFEPSDAISESEPERTNHSEISPAPLNVDRDILIQRETAGPNKTLSTKDNELILDLWRTGLTAKEVAIRIGRTEKTVLNRLTLLRKSLGDQVVPRRK